MDVSSVSLTRSSFALAGQRICNKICTPEKVLACVKGVWDWLIMLSFFPRTKNDLDKFILKSIQSARISEDVVNQLVIYDQKTLFKGRLFKSCPFRSDDPPYLKYIILLRHCYGSDLQKNDLFQLLLLDEAPLRTIVKTIAYMQKIDFNHPNLVCSRHDMNTFIAFSTIQYEKMIDRSLIERERCEFQAQIDRYPDISELALLESLAAFSGLKGSIGNFELEGNSRTLSYLEIINALICYLGIDDLEKKGLIEAFRDAAHLNIVGDETIEKIKRGEFVTVPLGFRDQDGGHHVDLVFYKDRFVICNRGCRITRASKAIECYNYDLSKINSKLIQYLVTQAFTVKKQGTGRLHQHSYLYLILPRILNAKRVNLALTVKNQKVGNCTKASQLTAFKVWVYLKELEKGVAEKIALATTKKIGKEVSVLLRRRAIQAVEILLEHSKFRFSRGEVLALINEAKKKIPIT